MIDFDLSGLDEASAREYAIAYITTIKKIEQDETKLSEELALWEKREKLAKDITNFENNPISQLFDFFTVHFIKKL